jgi:hypothetical protein
LLAAFEAFAPLANPFFAFEDQVGELISDLQCQKFDQRDPKNAVDFDVLMMFGLGQGALQQFTQQFAKSRVIETLDRPQFDAREIRRTRIVTDQVKKIVARRLDEFWAKEDIVVDVVHADGQRSHGNRDAIAFKFNPGRFGQARGEDLVGHDSAE